MKWKKGSRSRLVAGLVCAALVTGPTVLQAQEKDKLNILLANERTTSLYANFTGRELGFYADEGIDPNFMSTSTTVPYVAFLENGQADMVMLDAPQTFQAVNAGLPISVIYEAMQYAPEGIAVAEDSPITSLAELKGKTLGLASDRDLITAQIALDSVGISVDDVKTAVVGEAGPTLANAFRLKTVDAVAAAANDWTTIEANGVPVREITPPELSENPANSFVILASRAEELRPKVERFLRAWAKGVAAGQVDRQVVAGICREHVPEQWEVEEGGQNLLKFAVTMSNLPRTDKFGGLRPEIWKKVQGPLVKFGALDQPVDPATFLDDSFIEAANAFTMDEVKAATEKWRAENPDKIRE